MQSDNVTVYVVSGRTVTVGAGEVKRPGDPVELPRAEAERLLGLGFVQSMPPPRPQIPFPPRGTPHFALAIAKGGA